MGDAAGMSELAPLVQHPQMDNNQEGHITHNTRSACVRTPCREYHAGQVSVMWGWIGRECLKGTLPDWLLAPGRPS